MVTDSPGPHALPVTVSVLFQVNRNGCVAPFTSMPPETVMVAGEPSKPVKDTVEKRIARIRLFMGEVAQNSMMPRTMEWQATQSARRLKVNDGAERDGVQARSAYQHAVDFRLRH